MQQFIESIKTALRNQNWYVALFSCLALPDICGKIEYPTLTKSSERYVKWFNVYLSIKYKFLSGEDCYALRCSYLHEGSSDISEQKIQQVLTNFHFIFPTTGMIIHNNKINSVLQLQVDIFCNDIITEVEKWIDSVQTDQVKKTKIENLLIIHPLGSGF